MKIEWLSQAQNEYEAFWEYYKASAGKPYANKFYNKIQGAVDRLELFPEMGVLRHETLLGKRGYRVLFIDQYACIYRIENNTVIIYHLVDARKNYIYHIFGIE